MNYVFMPTRAGEVFFDYWYLYLIYYMSSWS